MGRLRKKNKHLPPKMYLIKGRYYWIGSVSTPTGVQRPSIPLGDDYARALIKWRELEGGGESAQSVGALVDRYIGIADVAEVTRKGYIRQSVFLKRIFKGFSPEDVRPVHIRQYLIARPPTAGKREIALLSAAWNSAREAGIFDLPNPCEGIRGKPRKRQTRMSTPAEEAALTAGPYQMAVIVDLALLTGLRQTDLRLLRLDAETEEGLRVTPSKTMRRTGMTQIFTWTPALRACWARAKLLRRRVGSVYVFPNQEGQPYTLDGFQSMWVAHRKRSGVEGLPFRALRRTAAKAVRATRGKDEAQLFLAHSSVTTTEIYTDGLEVNVVRPTR
jgi:integrase